MAPPEARVEISMADLVTSERSLRGSYLGSAVPDRLYRSGRLPLEDLVGDRIGLDEVPEGFRRVHDGHRGRQLVAIGG